MAYSQNGYTTITRDQCKTYTLDNFSIPLRADDCGYVLAKLARRFDKFVEDLGATETFGYSYRAIEGTNTYSNHASGTAVDLNSSRHPYGKSGTFSDEKLKKIRNILEDYDVVRWGGDYRSTKDEMHFEIDAEYWQVRLLASALRRGPHVYLSRLKYGKRNLDVYIVKRALRKKGFYDGVMNKYFSVELQEAYSRWQESLGYTGSNADGIPGPASLQSLGLNVN